MVHPDLRKFNEGLRGIEDNIESTNIYLGGINVSLGDINDNLKDTNDRLEGAVDILSDIGAHTEGANDCLSGIDNRLTNLVDNSASIGKNTKHLSSISSGITIGGIIISLSAGIIYMGLNKIANTISEQNTQPAYELRVEDVLGQPELEKFYQIGEHRVFLEIDEQPVESYFPMQLDSL